MVDIEMTDRPGTPDGSAVDFLTWNQAAGIRDQESATSASAPSSDVEDLFDWDQWDRDHGDQSTDVTAQSDAPAEDQTAATSPPPVDAMEDVASAGDSEDQLMTDAPSPVTGNLIPAVDPSSPHRASVLDFNPSSPPAGGMFPETPVSTPATSLVSSPATSPASTAPTSTGRTRHLRDVNETNKVRKAGACLPCRMDKVACNSLGVCQRCKEKKKLPSEACIRKFMGPMVLRARSERWASYDRCELAIPPAWFVGEVKKVRVHCSGNPDSPFLELVVRQFNHLDQAGPLGQALFGPAQNSLPHQSEIYAWAESQFLREPKHGFEGAMDSLLYAFVRASGLQTPHSSVLLNIWRVKVMLGLWGCKRLYPRHRDGNPHDGNFERVLESLRCVAAQMISELECKIAKELDEYCLKNKGELLIERWIALWQMILIYRQSLICVSERPEADVASLSKEAMRKHNFREDTKQLFDATVVTYAGLYTTKNTTLKALKTSKPSLPALEPYFSAVWPYLPKFHEQISRESLPTDKLFVELVVKKEQQALAKLPKALRP